MERLFEAARIKVNTGVDVVSNIIRKHIKNTVNSLGIIAVISFGKELSHELLDSLPCNSDNSRNILGDVHIAD